ncbi:MAG: hypothetical protein KA974_11060, partial [Saprospiraceae bacterium]|nr:hypothetical protein [Saprospiraceae bacterium]
MDTTSTLLQRSELGFRKGDILLISLFVVVFCLYNLVGALQAAFPVILFGIPPALFVLSAQSAWVQRNLQDIVLVYCMFFIAYIVAISGSQNAVNTLSLVGLGGIGLLVSVAPSGRWLLLIATETLLLTVIASVIASQHNSLNINIISYYFILNTVSFAGYFIINNKATPAVASTSMTMVAEVAEVAAQKHTMHDFLVLHDIQEPLRTLSQYVNLLQTRCESSMDEPAKEYLGFVQTNCSTINEMVKDYAKYKDVENEKLRFSTINTPALVNKVIKILGRKIYESNANIEIVGDMPNLYGDEQLLQRVFLNLLDNAIKYSSPTPDIKIYGSQTAAGIQITLRDNGRGIPVEDHEKIFRLFGKSYAADVISGSGVGLSICHNIIARHNGKIWVESGHYHQGSAFHFT